MEHRHFIIHKPYGFLSQFITNQKRNKNKLLSELAFDFPDNTMAIGRLDAKSEGLLLLTTDGKISYHITSNKVEKEYYVQVNGIISKEAIKELESGVEIGFDGKKYTTNPCKVAIIDPPNFPERTRKIRDDRHGPTSWLSVTLREGKFRQVRKMTAAVGFPTLRLVRIRIGAIFLKDLKPGEVIEVTKLLT
ncbi:pseudouridine synthase [Tenacibaculum sp. 190524A02b]|uniref:pseudouridine synthase n=1 Tax=Tenacibaculum vairaonense TaxID=3137860 RepID=UPI0031FB0E24